MTGKLNADKQTGLTASSIVPQSEWTALFGLTGGNPPPGTGQDRRSGSFPWRSSSRISNDKLRPDIAAALRPYVFLRRWLDPAVGSGLPGAGGRAGEDRGGEGPQVLECGIEPVQVRGEQP